MSASSGYQATLPVGLPSVAVPEVLGLLVGQAMDDLDAARLDIESALRLVAELAWKCGREHGPH